MASFIPSSESFAEPPTRASKLLQVNPAFTSIASERVFTASKFVAVRASNPDYPSIGIGGPTHSRQTRSDFPEIVRNRS